MESHFVPVDTDALGYRSLRAVPFKESGLEDVAERVFLPGAPYNQIVEGGSKPLMEIVRSAGIADATSLKETFQKAWDQAQALRHGEVIFAEKAAKWITTMFTREPERLFWHLRRLDVVSPSSAWAYVAEARGERAQFTTARELDQQRLMMIAPDESNEHTYRGTHLEAVNRALFYRVYGASFEPFPEALKATSEVRGTERFPWLGGNPDDIALFKGGTTPPPLLIDYKSPANWAGPDVEPPMEYVVQLHLYAMCMSVAGYKPGGMMLAPLHVNPVIARIWSRMAHQAPDRIPEIVDHAIFAIKMKSEDVHFDRRRVPMNKVLADEILAACSVADQRVLRGEVAPWPARKPVVTLSPEEQQRALRLHDAFVRANVGIKTLKDVADKSSAQLKGLYRDIDTTSQRPDLPLVMLSNSASLDAERAIKALEDRGVDVSPFRLPAVPAPVQPKYNMKAVEEKLKELDVDLSAIQVVQQRIELSRAKSRQRDIEVVSLEVGEMLHPIVAPARLAIATPKDAGIEDVFATHTRAPPAPDAPAPVAAAVEPVTPAVAGHTPDPSESLDEVA